MLIGGRSFEMDVGPASFTVEMDRDIKNRRALILVWVRKTQMRNYIHMTMVIVRMHWPFIQRISFFTSLGDNGD